MRKWLENPAGAAGIACALALAPVAAGAQQQFRIVADAQEGAWVLDDQAGAVSRCGMAAAVGPKVIDVFGADSEVRQGQELPARPYCRPAPGSDAAGYGGVPGFAAGGYGGMGGFGAAGLVGYGGGLLSVAVRPGMLGTGLSGYQIGSAAGMLGDGTFGYGYGAPDNQVIIVRPEWINVNLD
jgi:hypothetical protein